MIRLKSSGRMSSDSAEGIGAGGVAGGAGVRGTVSMLKRSGSDVGRARRGMVGSRPFELIVCLSVADLTGHRDRNSLTAMTLAPSRPSHCAVASPMPDLAPVTIATFLA
jgi:hypothetical protein